MLQENLQRSDDESVFWDGLSAFTSSTTEWGQDCAHAEAAPKILKTATAFRATEGRQAQSNQDVPSLQLEKRLFANMRTSGFSLLVQLVDSMQGVELLKNLVVDVEEELLKYHTQDMPRPDLVTLDIPGAIDALETVTFVGDLRQVHLKRQRLKRRLAEWSPASYLVVNAVARIIEARDNGVSDPALLQKLKRTIGQYHLHRNRMAQANMRLVYSVANRFRHLGLPFEDLVQEGHLGLIKAIERFDISKGFRFSTYAHIVISQSIHLALDKQMGLVRLPFKALREKASVEKIRQSLEQSLGRVPHSHELNLHLPDNLEYKATHIAHLVEPSANSQHLYSMPDDAELLAGCSVSEQDQLTASLKHADMVEYMLGRLNERESYIVRMRYGIGLGKEFTLEEISMAMGLSRERVRQLANHAVEKLGRIYATEY
jgi:RNA polymerase sigma factor (sigma-70 family)